MAYVVGAVVKKGMIPPDTAPTVEDGATSQETWCPQPEFLEECNRKLQQDPEMSGKLFVLPEAGKTTSVSAQLLKLLPDVDGKRLEHIPPTYVVLFNAVLQGFCADPDHSVISGPVCRIWLVLLMEALVTQDFGLEIFPKASKDRIFYVVGHFVRVSEGVGIDGGKSSTCFVSHTTSNCISGFVGLLHARHHHQCFLLAKT